MSEKPEIKAELDELDRLAGAATAGPWIAVDKWVEPRYVGKPDNGVDTCDGYTGICEPEHTCDVEFIAYANPERIRRLTGRLRYYMGLVENEQHAVNNLTNVHIHEEFAQIPQEAFDYANRVQEFAQILCGSQPANDPKESE